ncbi:hypothetical protein OHS58_38910 [Amycolatopsis sp. NBC_00348]|uniref:hypothetical protein n=1 Tax=Amycolatopsis sp. NBC_00348 TaxID=2975956 RepID=UPI002E26C078
MEPLSLPARAALLVLMTLGDAASNSQIRETCGFVIKKPVRDELVEHEYVTLRPGPHNSIIHELTEDGWAACRDELRAAAPTGADRGYRVLYSVVNLFERHLTTTKTTLADVLLANVEPPAPKIDVDAEIRAAYQALTGEPGSWLKLAKLRDKLALPQAAVDEALLRLDLLPEVQLISEVSQKNISDADRKAAVHIGNQDKHLIAIKQS